MEVKKLRNCGACNEPKVPYGLDWPFWKDGRPLCVTCFKSSSRAAAPSADKESK